MNIPCQYDGKAAKLQLGPREIEAMDDPLLIPVCPEQLSGLATPRKPVEIIGGDGHDVLQHGAYVKSVDGEDFTAQFIRGAEIVYDIAKLTGASRMITQHRSPSCSSNGIYDGSFCHNLKPGNGVCAAFLLSMGIELVDITSLKSQSKSWPG